MGFTAIFICPSCLAVADYKPGSGLLPPVINGKDITLELPIVHPLTVEATEAVFLQPGFQTNDPNSTFIAEIVPCTSGGGGGSGGGKDLALGGPDIYDTLNMIDPTQLTSTSETTGVKAGEGNTLNASGPSKLQILPTVSNGTFLVTSSPADLENISFPLVIDAFRQDATYRLQNGGNTTVNLNLSLLGNGLYFIQINNGVKTTTQKVIINK